MPSAVGIAGKPVSKAKDAERVSILGKVGMNSWGVSLCLFPGVVLPQEGGRMEVL